jgi:arsenate reductase (thioredoxin)
MNMKKISIFCPILALFSCQSPEQSKPENITEATNKISTMSMYPALQLYADSLTFEFEMIPEERRAELKQLADYIRAQKDSAQPVQLTFICTHNSRRSHLGQIWAAAAASFYGVDGVETFSGGTEATAFNPRAVAAVKRAGFVIDSAIGENPRYRVHLREGDAGLVCFSKKYDDAANPQKDFAAIMTCSQADAECPYIPGAQFRLSLPYNDPKEADGTPQETERYNERCRQIGREMMYAFSLV